MGHYIPQKKKFLSKVVELHYEGMGYDRISKIILVPVKRIRRWSSHVTLFDSMVNKINDRTIFILMRGQIHVQNPSQTNTAPGPEKAKKPQQ